MLLVLSFLLVSAFAEIYTYETGTKVRLDNELNGSIDLVVTFKKEFNSVPKIALGIAELDLVGKRLMTEVIDASNKGFSIRVESDNLKSISFNWLATDNPLVHVEYVKSNQENLQVPILEWEINTKPLVASFLIGFDLKEDSRKVQQHLELEEGDITKLSLGGANEYKLCMLFSQFDNSFTTGQQGLEVTAADHPWLSQERADNTMMQVSYDVPTDLVDFVDIVGISEFSSESQEIRVSVQETNNEENQVTVEYGTWDDSKVSELGFAAMYFGNGNVRFFDPNCAQLYSECDFQGTMVKICNSQEKIQYTGEVKSIHLPKDSIFTLFKGEGFEGKRLTFDKSSSCFEPLYLGQKLQ